MIILINYNDFRCLLCKDRRKVVRCLPVDVKKNVFTAGDVNAHGVFKVLGNVVLKEASSL